MELAVVPVFQSEITPKHARGFVVGTYQISLFVSAKVPFCSGNKVSDVTIKDWRTGHQLYCTWHW